MKYKCDSCPYESYRKDCLKMSSVHVKTKFHFPVTTITGLVKHKQLKHEKSNFCVKNVILKQPVREM